MISFEALNEQLYSLLCKLRQIFLIYRDGIWLNVRYLLLLHDGNNKKYSVF